MAAVTEVKGSRNEWMDGQFIYGEMLHVGAAVTDSFPATDGTSFFTSSTQTEGTTVTSRRCISRRFDLKTIPGAVLCRSLYRAYRAYATAAATVDASEVQGSRTEWQDGQYKYGEMLFVGATTAVFPDVNGGSFFTPRGGSIESGITGRRCISRRFDMWTVPGVVFCRCVYRAVISFA